MGEGVLLQLPARTNRDTTLVCLPSCMKDWLIWRVSKLMAIMALSLALDLHQASFYLALDYLDVITKIKTFAPCHYATILREIDLRRSSFREASFGYGKQDKNGEAHALAKVFAPFPLGNMFGYHLYLTSFVFPCTLIEEYSPMFSKKKSKFLTQHLPFFSASLCIGLQCITGDVMIMTLGTRVSRFPPQILVFALVDLVTSIDDKIHRG